MEARLWEAQALTPYMNRTVDADEAVCHRSVSSKILGYTGYTLPDQRK